ncbi:MAG: hypothetical protein COU31_04420 [Candidatus Magasanikbacteria bacterium CG10_big_fil_rev_8_21_14_0_10_40_10]|uniref:DNA polymerase III subunit delta n=1 Tax=Candidatus Magasanikbacteria bacterium CG10_big_fil_rev_8_21_14_0_10_40_10 TaxID=1974648 RepID=A0A2M6W306_9BACT|nr:MAG: hypothetical protein COU31_04420 [Candidatus Magasanikbacteria bacterium CG10_big_fil_rev_8_21_14_0_10_40_10]
MEFIGNKKILDFFRRSIDGGRLVCAYCLSGVDQVGKRKLANLIASQLLNTSADKLPVNADYYYLSREFDDKTDKLKKDISIDQARALKHRFCGKSWLGGYRVAIIDEAEKLNKESGNALLKMLEEAGEKTVFFLLTQDDHALLPTIRSRCQILYLNITPVRQIEQSLIELGHEQIKAKLAAELSWGRPGRAVRLLQDENYLILAKEQAERLHILSQKPFYERVSQMTKILKSKKGIEKEKMLLELESWQMAIHQNMGQLAVNNVELSEAINLSRKMLLQNVSPALVLENLLLKIN